MRNILGALFAAIIVWSQFFSIAVPVAKATELHNAARKGDLAEVEALITAGSDINETDGEGETALHKAAKANKIEVVRYLIDAGADPMISGMGPFGATGLPIHVAAKFGRVESLKVLIDAGVDVNNSDPGVGTPLHLALRAGRNEAVDFLRAAGAGSVSLPAIDSLIAAADPVEGRNIANTCQLCHRMEPGSSDTEKPGPSLWNIVGRKKASVEGYEYSNSLLEIGGIWSFADLNSLIADARAFVPGTKMDGVAGISGEERRASLLRYLRDLADNPVDLPE